MSDERIAVFSPADELERRAIAATTQEVGVRVYRSIYAAAAMGAGAAMPVGVVSYLAAVLRLYLIDNKFVDEGEPLPGAIRKQLSDEDAAAALRAFNERTAPAEENLAPRAALAEWGERVLENWTPPEGSAN